MTSYCYNLLLTLLLHMQLTECVVRFISAQCSRSYCSIRSHENLIYSKVLPVPLDTSKSQRLYGMLYIVAFIVFPELTKNLLLFRYNSRIDTIIAKISCRTDLDIVIYTKY